MARFNAQKVDKTETVNRAGGKAYKKSTKLELASILLTSFVQDQFYRTKEETLDQLADAVRRLKPSEKDFAAKAAIYARNEWGMRSITHVVAAQIAKEVKGARWTRPFFYKVVRRVDDMTEILALYLNRYGKPIPNSLKDGLASAFDKFDRYQLAKYRAEGKDVSLVDVVNLVRPIPTDKNRDALADLVNDRLVSTGTWESEQTKAGQTAKTEEEKAELKAENWKKLISERKIGYFALLRNLRNIATQASESLDDALFMLRDPKLIRKSLVLPFRFWTALHELEVSFGVGNAAFNKIAEALSDAADIALANVPVFKGKTVVVVDESASMNGKPIMHASIFAATILRSNPDADLIMFSGGARKVRIRANDSLMTMADAIKRSAVQGGTNLSTVFGLMSQEAMEADRIIILTDEQSWMETYRGGPQVREAFARYAKKMGKRPLVYSWDLQGYGDMQFPEQSVCCLTGFSEKAFDIIELLETDRNALVNEIEKIDLV